ncbi:MAG: GNAT family N-acetyltransferase [Planctomycetes bacterium]|nr:GNAT family N-acetyltransferase [Planctomycetota bacterium]
MRPGGSLHVRKSEFLIRLATSRDLPALRRQRDGMFRDMGWTDEPALRAADLAYARWARARLRSGRFAAFLALSPDGRVAAGGAVWLREQQPGPRRCGLLPYLLSMYTEPEFRGKGLATRIVRAAEAWCRKRGLTKMTLHASRMGRGVYRKLGWERTWEMETLLR